MLVVVALFPPAAGAAPASVSIGSTLSPSDLTVTVGTDVTWTNNDGERHRMRSTSGPFDFDSGNLDTGESFTVTFDVEGTFAYVDDRDRDNSSYHGTVTVTTDAVDPGEPPPPPPPAGDVTIVDDTFRPGSITVNVGGSVTWSNQDREHTVTARDLSWDSGIFDSGQTYTRTFNTAGTFEYFCVIHPEMVATVVVAGDSGEPPPPQPPPPPPTPPPPPPPPPPGSSDVSVIDNDFDPGTKTISVGSTVRWVNNGQLPHTATAAGQFDSGILMSGDTWSRTFNSAGTFNYICTLHPEMQATIVVTGGEGDPPLPPPGEDPPPPPAEDPPPPPAPSGAISIIDNDYQPGSRTVAVGSTVRWVNNGQLPHTVTVGGQFDSGFLMSGDTWSRTFNSAGTFDYICTIHPEMVGTIVVTGGEGDPPPPPPGEDPPSSEDPPPPPPSGAISIIDNDYQPGSRTVAVGSTVRWVNNGQLPHTVTVGGQFDSGFLMSGDTWSRTFDSAGTFNYICTLHPEMVGTIVVTGSGDGLAGEEVSADEQVDNEPLDEVVATDGEPGEFAVAMIDNAYDPTDVEIRVGDSITWRNTGQLPHTATARDESFDSGFVMNGEVWTLQFNNVGVFEYYCTIHPEMVGTVTVVPSQAGAGGGVGAAVAASTPEQAVNAAADSLQAPAVAGVGGATEASVMVMLLIVLGTVGFIVYLVHEVDFAPDPEVEQ